MEYFNGDALHFAVVISETKTVRVLRRCDAQGNVNNDAPFAVSKLTGIVRGQSNHYRPERWSPIIFEHMAELEEQAVEQRRIRDEKAAKETAARNAEMAKARAVIEPAVAQAKLVNEFLGLYMTEAESPRYGKSVIAFRQSKTNYQTWNPDDNSFGAQTQVEVTIWNKNYSADSDYQGHTYSPEITNDVVNGICRIWAAWMQ